MRIINPCLNQMNKTSTLPTNITAKKTKNKTKKKHGNARNQVFMRPPHPPPHPTTEIRNLIYNNQVFKKALKSNKPNPASVSLNN